MKIVYCINSVKVLGGIERVTVVKANALAEIAGNEVYIVVLSDKGGKYIAQISPKVTLVDLDAEFFPDGFPGNRIQYVRQMMKKNKEYREKLSAFLHRVNPDVVVSVGHKEFEQLPKIRGPWKIVREVHHDRNFRMVLCKGESVFRHITAVYGTLSDRRVYPKYDKVVTLTQGDKAENWRGAKNVAVMPNPVSFVVDVPSSLTPKRIVSVGRLSVLKSYDTLVRAFAIVRQKHPDWELEIVGGGELKADLQRLIHSLSLEEHVILTGRITEVQEHLLKGSIFALTSVLEGFGLAIVEAMECGLPVVCTDCNYGPREIVEDGEDGFLVPVGAEKDIASKLCLLIENDGLRKKMGENARRKAALFHPQHLAERWMAFFEELTGKE
ncbi:MAG: glycosyltransferase family 4 protein [Bacteroidales bacterium]|nr:glycosyltransferase family 4 protein [Bacteroidales bacterium]